MEAYGSPDTSPANNYRSNISSDTEEENSSQSNSRPTAATSNLSQFQQTVSQSASSLPTSSASSSTSNGKQNVLPSLPRLNSNSSSLMSSSSLTLFDMSLSRHIASMGGDMNSMTQSSYNSGSSGSSMKNSSKLGKKRPLTSFEIKLFEYVRESNVDGVELLLATSKIDINCVDDRGYCPIHVAAYVGNLPVMEKLVAYPANLESIESQTGSTALHKAAIYNHPQILRCLLRNVANPDCQSSIPMLNTPLHEACKEGHLECVKVLLEYYANPVILNGAHRTPLDVAKQYERQEIVTYLEQYQHQIKDLLPRQYRDGNYSQHDDKEANADRENEETSDKRNGSLKQRRHNDTAENTSDEKYADELNMLPNKKRKEINDEGNAKEGEKTSSHGVCGNGTCVIA
jgi:hypothetical protein